MGILDGWGVGKWGADRWTQEMQQKQFDRDAIIAAVAGEMRKTIEAHRQQENRDDAIRAGILPAPLDAPDAPVNPDWTIRRILPTSLEWYDILFDEDELPPHARTNPDGTIRGVK